MIKHWNEFTLLTIWKKCNVPYEGEKDRMRNCKFCQDMRDYINHIFRPSSVYSDTRIQICMTLARPALGNGTESWRI
jgi:hypothetical protein